MSRFFRRNGFRICIYGLILAFIAAAFAATSGHNREQEIATLTNAVEQDISAYYARNGYYPDDIEVLRREYGLTYDADRYYIGYDLRGANIRPNVKVVDLGGKS